MDNKYSLTFRVYICFQFHKHTHDFPCNDNKHVPSPVARDGLTAHHGYYTHNKQVNGKEQGD